MRTTDDDRERHDIAHPSSRRDFLEGLVGTGATLAVVWTSTGCQKKKAAKAAAGKKKPAKAALPDLTIPTSVDGFGNVSVIPGSEIASITIMALISAVLPTNEGLPGGLQVGVHHYMGKTFADPKFKGVRGLLAKGAAGLNQMSLRAHNAILARIPCPQRVAVLREARAQADADFPWGLFQDAFLDFAVEGYVGHPARGGNTNGVVWEKLQITVAGKPFVNEHPGEAGG